MSDKERTIFYFVRHGETKWNVERRMQGHKDSELTELGKQQALRLRGKFRDVRFDRVLSSDMPRAVRTARLIIGDSSLEVVTTPALRERNYGSYHGEPTEKYLTELGERLSMLKTLPDQERRRFRLAPGIETGQEIYDHFTGKIEEELELHRGEQFLVVSHGPVLREAIAYFDPRVTGLTSLFFRNGGYMKAVDNGEGFTIEEMVGVEGWL